MSIESIKARLEAATPGPWGWEETNVCGGSEPRTWFEIGPVIPADYDGPQEIDWDKEVCATAGDDWQQQWSNADLITHAPDDLRALLAVAEAAADIFKDRTGQVEIAAAGMNRMEALRVSLAALEAKP